MADNKQQALVNAIAAGAKDAMQGDFKGLYDNDAKIIDAIAKLTVTTNAIVARLETIESAISSGTGAPKRTVRGAAAKGGAKKAPAKKGGAADDGKSRVTNALLFCRWILANNYEDAQETYGTPENLEAADQEASVSKFDREKQPSQYWSAFGAFLWKSLISDEQKEEIRNQFLAWKEQAVRDGAEDQLDEDE
jgi:hypothetical protein